jgi:hypothetical protein
VSPRATADDDENGHHERAPNHDPEAGAESAEPSGSNVRHALMLPDPPLSLSRGAPRLLGRYEEKEIHMT